MNTLPRLLFYVTMLVFCVLGLIAVITASNKQYGSRVTIGTVLVGVIAASIIKYLQWRARSNSKKFNAKGA
jgi:hypothetical protein